jgi:hypothetical protein
LAARKESEEVWKERGRNEENEKELRKIPEQ